MTKLTKLTEPPRGLKMTKIDTEVLKSNNDLRVLASQHTTLSGRDEEQYGPCPKCEGTDRFHVKRDGFFCRRCKPLEPSKPWHDAIAFVMWLKELDFKAACDWLSNGSIPTLAGSPITKPATRSRSRLIPPGDQWQARALQFVKYAQEQLWQPTGKAGLDYLLGRGLTEETIKAAGLGFNPKDINDVSIRWGVIDKKSIWLPGPGIVLPWFIDGQIHRVNIRLLEIRSILRKNGTFDEIKYIGPTGWAGANPLYNADSLHPAKPALLVEGEFCALSVNQKAGDLVTAVATGSTESSRARKWIARLAACPLVLVAFDAEPDKGDKAARVWLDKLPNARCWRPLLKDVNDMLKAEIDVREWIKTGLPPAELETESVTAPEEIVTGEELKNCITVVYEDGTVAVQGPEDEFPF
jgi:DNA primase